MKRWLKRIGIVLAVLAAIVVLTGVYAYYIEPRQFVIVEESLAVPNWDPALNGFKVVAIADIHAGSNYAPIERLQYMVEQANAQDPDVIVLLGDYVSESEFDRERLKLPEGMDRTAIKVPVETIADSLAGLRARHGVFAVIGNHDWYHNEQKVTREFERVGINVLTNEVSELSVNGRAVRIWGIEDFWRHRRVPAEPLDSLQERANILAITHNPDSLFQSPADISLMFAGHSHGGQLNWPIFGPLALFNDPRFMDGLAVVDGKHVYVTSGVGTSVLPLRLRVPPEIAVITVNSANRQ